jgi:hypothetical protein
MECQLYFAEVPQKRESTVAGMKGTRKEWESVPDPTKHIRNVKKIFSPIVKKNKNKKAADAAAEDRAAAAGQQ